MGGHARPTAAQVEAARAATAWYLGRYWGTPADSGLARAFCDPAQVGHFAITEEALGRGDGDALFKLLIATTMFQRRQDQQILRVLRGLSAEDVEGLTDPRRLLARARGGGCCELAATLATLHGRCDLTKDDAGRGICGAYPERACDLKRHSELLRRYGHFGKVPTSAALMVEAEAGGDLGALYARALEAEEDPAARARWLEARLSTAWRVSQKISNMFLSALTNPDLSGALTPWRAGVDWRYFIVIDSNVDLFLESIGYEGAGTYEARRGFLQALAAQIDLQELEPRLHKENPRLIQQALYLFMSASNRRARPQDCMHLAPLSCGACPGALRERCPVTA
jgi:hypothetical protein